MPCSSTHSARDEACLSGWKTGCAERRRSRRSSCPISPRRPARGSQARMSVARAGIERLISIRRMDRRRAGAGRARTAALAASPSCPRWRRMALCVLAPADASHRPRRDRRSQPRDHVAGDPDRIHRGIAPNRGGDRAVVAGGAAGCSSGRSSGLLRQLCLIARSRGRMAAGHRAARAQYPREPPKRMLSPARTTLVVSLTSTSPGRNPASSGVKGTRPEP